MELAGAPLEAGQRDTDDMHTEAQRRSIGWEEKVTRTLLRLRDCETVSASMLVRVCLESS